MTDWYVHVSMRRVHIAIADGHLSTPSTWETEAYGMKWTTDESKSILAYDLSYQIHIL